MKYGDYSWRTDALTEFPSWPQLRDGMETFVAANPGIASIETIGISEEGREIRAVHITDKAHPTDNKEVVLIIMGRHGDELGTRAVAVCLLDWLASTNAAETLTRQQVIVVPAANPDGCEKGVFGLPGERLSRLEKESVVKFGLSFIPDAVIDVHSVGMEKYGYNWGGLEAVIIDEQARAGEDQYILHQMADRMIQGAARRGFPFVLHPISFYRNLKQRAAGLVGGGFNNHVNQVFYDACHALTFGIEVNHYTLDAEAAARSGLGAITALLEAGNKRFPWDYRAGYPNKVLFGDFLASLRPRGNTAAETRVSRQVLWTNRHLFGAPFIPYRRMDDKHSVDLTFNYAGERHLQGGLTAAVRLRGRPRIRRVEANGGARPYAVRTDNCSSYLFIDFEDVEPGQHQSTHIEF